MLVQWDRSLTAIFWCSKLHLQLQEKRKIKGKAGSCVPFRSLFFTITQIVTAILPPHPPPHTLTNFLKVRHHRLTEAGFLTDTVQHAAVTQLEVLLLTSVRSALGPWGVLQYGLSYGLKRREKKKNLFKSRQGGHTCFNDRYFLKLVCVWVIMYFSIVGEMRNFTHGIWKSLWLTTLLDSHNVAINSPKQKTCNCVGHTRNNLSFSFKLICYFKSQLFYSFI